jgi:hypothetical protein
MTAAPSHIAQIAENDRAVGLQPEAVEGDEAAFMRREAGIVRAVGQRIADRAEGIERRGAVEVDAAHKAHLIGRNAREQQDRARGDRRAQKREHCRVASRAAAEQSRVAACGIGVGAGLQRAAGIGRERDLRRRGAREGDADEAHVEAARRPVRGEVERHSPGRRSRIGADDNL